MPHANEQTSDSRPKDRSRLQFSLRTLVLVVLVFGCILGWLSSFRIQSQREHAAWTALLKSGGYGMAREGTSFRPGWQRLLLGDDSHAHIKRISLMKSENPDEALAYIAAFSELEDLNMEEANTTDVGLSHLVGNKQLKGLSLIKTKITDKGLTSVSKLPQLEWLYLGGNPQLSDAGLQELRGLVHLKKLGLDDTQINDDGFIADVAKFTELEMLSLMRTEITDKSIVQLSSLSRLKELWLYDTLLSKEGVAKLKQALPNCGIVYSHRDDKAPSAR